MEPDSEFQQLLDQVRCGDEQACAELLRHYEPEVQRFVRYRLNSPKLRRFLDSLDVCQSVFANFFVKAADGQFDLENPRQLQQLLFTMAGNRLLDHARKHAAQRRQADQAVAGLTIDWVADSAPEPGQVAEAQDIVDVLRSRLSDEERGVVDEWMQGEDWAVIGQRVGASPEAVRKRFSRAVDRAARELGWECLT
jgi:RNA polymerase sigma-70 factor (ECF subfamily)